MKIEGKPSKRFGVAYGGDVLGSWDTAKEAVDEYRNFERLIRPVTDRAKQYRYSFREGRKTITLEQLVRAAKAEGEG